MGLTLKLTLSLRLRLRLRLYFTSRLNVLSGTLYSECYKIRRDADMLFMYAIAAGNCY